MADGSSPPSLPHRLLIPTLYCQLLQETEIYLDFISKIISQCSADFSTLQNGYVTVNFGNPVAIEAELHKKILKETLEADEDDEDVKKIFENLLNRHPTRMRYAGSRCLWEVCALADIMGDIRSEIDQLRVKQEDVSVPAYAINFIILKFDWMKGDIMEKVHQSVTIALSPIQGNELPRLLVTAVRIKMKSAKAYIAKLVSSLETKEVKISFARALFLQSWNTQKMLLQIEEEDNCRVEVLEKRQQVVFRMSSPEGQQVLVCEGSMAITDCHVLMLPLCDGQEVWPPKHKQILERGTLSENMSLYREAFLKEGPVIRKCDPDDSLKIVAVHCLPCKWNEVESDKKQRAQNAYTSTLKQCNEFRQSVAMEARLNSGVPLKTSVSLILTAVVEVFTRSTSSACRAVVIYSDCAEDTNEVCNIIEKSVPSNWHRRPQLVFDAALRPKQGTLEVCADRDKLDSIISTITKEPVPLKYHHLAKVKKLIPLPLFMANYTKHHLETFKATVTSECHEIKKIVVTEVTNKLCHQSDLLVTAERLGFPEVEKVLNKELLKTGLLQESVPVSVGNFLLSNIGQKIVKEVEKTHCCHVTVSVPARRLVITATSPTGTQLQVCAGSMAASNQVLVVPFCLGQSQWPVTHLRALQTAGLPVDIPHYSTRIGPPPRPWSMTCKSTGLAEGQTIIVMYVPNANDAMFDSHVQAACKETLESVTIPEATIALPVSLSANVPLEKSLIVLLPVIKEFLGAKKRSVSLLLYLDTHNEAAVASLTDIVHRHLSTESTSSSPWIFCAVPLSHINRAENRVKVQVGELENIQADIVVNTTDPFLTHKGGLVSTTLLQAAGPELTEQYQREYPNGFENRLVVITDSFQLRYPKKIYHVVLPQSGWEPHKKTALLGEVRKRVLACLILASMQRHNSIAFPAIGTGSLKYPADLVAETMFAAVHEFFKEMPCSTLSEVSFVWYSKNKEVVKEFKDIKPKTKPDQQAASVSQRLEQKSDEPEDVNETIIRITGKWENVGNAMDALKQRR